MKYCIAVLLLAGLVGCKHDYFRATEYDDKITDNPDYEWVQKLPQEMPEDYNTIIDTVIVGECAGNNENNAPYLVKVYGPIRDSVYDLGKSGWNDIMHCEGWGRTYWRFKVWSKYAPELHWHKKPHA